MRYWYPTVDLENQKLFKNDEAVYAIFELSSSKLILTLNHPFRTRSLEVKNKTTHTLQ